MAKSKTYKKVLVVKQIFDTNVLDINKTIKHA
jgi:hypothetical protein